MPWTRPMQMSLVNARPSAILPFDVPAKTDKTERRPDGRHLLSNYDSEALIALLSQYGRPTAATSAARRLLRYAYAYDALDKDAPWNAEAFRSLNIGAWAHEALAQLSPKPSLDIEHAAIAEDGTSRLVLRTFDQTLIETVIIPGPQRLTLCISSQVGCARACTFCETGAHGLTRQLSTAEIVDQVRVAKRYLRRTVPSLDVPNSPTEISNIVYMGMGEPFDNFDAVARSTRLLTDGSAFGLARSRVTVSTVGVVDKLNRFFVEANAELAVSLNAIDDKTRSAIMPVNTRFNLATLRQALLTCLPRGRRVFFEYVLFEGQNDSDEDARRLSEYVEPIPCRVNVIPVNPGPNQRDRPPSADRMDAFVGVLAERGVRVLVRRPRGQAVGGACGQLAGARRLSQLGSARA